MSSLEEEKLPVELTKLEIAPTLPIIKLMDSNLPLIMNPFYDTDIKNNASDLNIEIDMRKRNIGRSCRECRLRRSSESVLDDFKASSQLDVSPTTTTSPTPGVHRHPLKKSSATTSRKIILREPVLRALQSCFHSRSGARRKLINNITDYQSTTEMMTNATGQQKVKSSRLIERGLADFSDLVEECQTMLERDVDFRGNRFQQLSLSQRNSKNFTTMQSTSNPFGGGRRGGGGGGGGSLDKIFPCNSIMSSPSPLDQNATGRPSVNLNANANTSCSQQAAGNSATATTTSTCDDVTIDELASYFDTLVHIPKKMSSMAEMMYI